MSHVESVCLWAVWLSRCVIADTVIILWSFVGEEGRLSTLGSSDSSAVESSEDEVPIKSKFCILRLWHFEIYNWVTDKGKTRYIYISFESIITGRS